jgi:hypothetical protein
MQREFFLGKPLCICPLGRPRRRWQNNMKMNFREVDCELGWTTSEMFLVWAIIFTLQVILLETWLLSEISELIGYLNTANTRACHWTPLHYPFFCLSSCCSWRRFPSKILYALLYCIWFDWSKCCEQEQSHSSKSGQCSFQVNIIWPFIYWTVMSPDRGDEAQCHVHGITRSLIIVIF